MFSNKSALAGFIALALSAAIHAQEKHLTLDDIDGLARQNIVDSMRKSSDASKPAAGVGLNAPLAPRLCRKLRHKRPRSRSHLRQSSGLPQSPSLALFRMCPDRTCSMTIRAGFTPRSKAQSS